VAIAFETDNYFAYTLDPSADTTKISLSLPLFVPIFKLAYTVGGDRRVINVFPTLQFLYSHHIRAEYITSAVRDSLATFDGDPVTYGTQFFQAVSALAEMDKKSLVSSADASAGDAAGGAAAQLQLDVLVNHIRQSPQYTLAGLWEGVYIIGMKDQFNVHDLPAHPMQQAIQYVADEMGFVLFCKEGLEKSVNSFGPYFIEQYLLMDVLSKQEVAQNVVEYYVNHRERLQRGVEGYSEAQGRGFVCWRFIHEFRQAAQATHAPLGC